VGTGFQSRISNPAAALSLYHLLDPEVLANPYPLFERLRREAPVHWDAFLHAWVVTRYVDVVEVLHSFSADRTPTPEQLTAMGLSQLSPIAEVMVKQMLFMDAPAHTRLRGLASKAFTPAKVELLKAHIQDIANSLLDKIEQKGGSMDVIADLADPLPAIVTAEMLGVPVSDHNQLKKWSANFAEMLGNFQHNPERAQTMLQTVEEMTSYFLDATREIKAHPREGLIHSLLIAELDGDRFTEEEVVANTIVTMVGGQETTTNLIGNGLLTLLRNPDEIESLRRDLSLIPSAVEEMLRYESPSQHTARLAPTDRMLGGKQIQKRQAVIAVMAAANRDPERFPDPDRFDIRRADNRHLAFGYAAHFCFGAPLARAEGQIAFETMLRRLPNLRLEPQELVWRNNLGLRGLAALQVSFGELRPGSTPANGNGNRLPVAVATDSCPVVKAAPAAGDRQRLIAKYLSGNVQQHKRIIRRTSSSAVPLSFPQQQILLHSQMAPEVPLYNELATIYRHGPLDVDVLERCLTEIVRRHEAWRTNFEMAQDPPMQVVRPATEIKFRVLDLRGLPKAERDAEALRVATEQTRKPFDLTREPLFRAALLQLEDAEYQLCLSLHHLIFDGLSIYRVLLPELVALYGAFCRGESSPLSELPVQYSDFADWQHGARYTKMLSPQLAYWRSQLSGQLPVLQLPTDRVRPSVHGFRGAMQPVRLSSELSRSLRELSRREGVTLFMTLAASFSVLLQRYSGQDEMLIGTVAAGRKPSELEGLLGCFQNPLALRLNLAGNPTFREVLRRTREVTLGALSNDEVPFESVVNEIQSGRDLSRDPLLQVLISLAPSATAVDPGWDVSQMRVDVGAAKFDLDLELDDRPEGIGGRFVYDTDLFDAMTVARMAGHWETLLRSIVKAPQSFISLFPLLTQAEKDQLVLWNQTATSYPSERCVHELVELQALRTPQSAAVVQEKKILTYAELNGRANQLARYLQKRGVGPEVRVGVSLQSSPEMMVALLAVLKAGGACVPLDPSYPPERLAYMFQDAQVPLVITDSGSITAVPVPPSQLIDLSSQWQNVAEESPENLRCGIAPESVAYVIYTSGSTGKPRGVMLTNAGLVNHNVAAIALYGLQPGDRVLQFSTISFDIAIEEIFPAWISGATLVLKTQQMALSAREFWTWIRERRITVLDLPTAYWHELVHQMSDVKQTLPPKLRLVIVGGEKASADALRTWRKVAGNRVQWINTYGPTEASIIATSYEPGSEIPSVLPIGRPIANTQVHLLDAQLQPVPVGIRGELHIGGVGVARGYLNRPEMTAEKFIADPFRPGVGARLYRTGDMARFLPSGEIEFLGRADHQVKIRGFRVELGEIEVMLNQHPAVSDAVVMVREDESGAKSLVAYFVVKQPPAPKPTELHRFLKDRLPEYMVPHAFVALSSFPLTPNGKVDRRALPIASAVDMAVEEGFSSPKDALESRLVKVWELVLGRHPIGVRQNFFELGGHSLLAVRLMHRIEQEFRKRLPIAALLQASTIEQLANVLRGEGCSLAWSSLVPIKSTGSKPPLFCVHGAGGTVMVYRELAQNLEPDQPLYGLQAQGLDGKQPRLNRVEEMAAHYLREIQAIQLEGPYFLGGLSFGGTVAFEMAQQLRARGEQVGLLFLFDAFPRGYETKSALLRKLWRMPREEQLEYIGRKIRQFQLGKRIYRHFLPRALKDVRKAIDQAGVQYEIHPYPGAATLFCASERSLRGGRDPYVGWRKLTTGGLEVYEIPGGHVSILAEPQVKILARHLRACLDRAQAALFQEEPSLSK
jgi:amino acid adenylation domain-containing protein